MLGAQVKVNRLVQAHYMLLTCPLKWACNGPDDTNCPAITSLAVKLSFSHVSGFDEVTIHPQLLRSEDYPISNHAMYVCLLTVIGILQNHTCTIYMSRKINDKVKYNIFTGYRKEGKMRWNL